MLGRSETADLRQLTDLVGRFFRVPVAYAAMLGHRDRVMTRIGSGSDYWPYLKKTFPLQSGLACPLLVRDVREGIPDGTDWGDLQFLASAPLVTFCGHHLGVLVIGDVTPRPEFSQEEHNSLVAFAGVLALQIEARMIASQSIESQLRCEEAEERFCWLANRSETLIACGDADGSCAFVNDAWLKFTGRFLQSELGDGWQDEIHPQHLERILSLYWQGLQARQPFTAEFPFFRHDGVYRRVQCSATPRFLKDGGFRGFIISLHDLSAFDEKPLF